MTGQASPCPDRYAHGHRGCPTCLSFYRPDAPQPATTDDTVALDRETLTIRIETAITDDGNREPRTKETRYVAHVAASEVMAALAARGDAATPTEVEWGVRVPAFGVNSEFIARNDIHGRPFTRKTAEDYARGFVNHPTIVRRTASAWLEVTP